MKLHIAIITAVAAAAGLIGYRLGGSESGRELATDIDRQSEMSVTPSTVSAADFPFVNPLLDCAMFVPATRGTFETLNGLMQQRVNTALNDGEATHVSVYVRTLNSGPWMGIDEEHDYAPASLMKVPLMIAVLRQAEIDQTFLARRIGYFSASGLNDQAVVRDVQITPGRDYTVRELLEAAVKYSDNEAAELLTREVGAESPLKVLVEMGITSPSDDLTGDFVSVREYAATFRLLYNATYLGREMSNRALELLTQTHFNYGLRAGVPDSVAVAHKFGERTLPEGGLRQLHDCGVVYAPGSPYLICVMTQGREYSLLANIISDISRLVYSNATS